MAKSNLAHKWEQAITPQQFMDGMTKNKETFHDNYQLFNWTDLEDHEFFKMLSHRDDLRSLIIAADWCGDVVRNIPVVFRAFEEASLPTKVLIMEEHLDVMDEYLTMGGRSIPVVIITDTGGHVLGQWGPRPEHVQELMVAFREENPDREAPDYKDKMALVRQAMMDRYGEGSASHAMVIRELREVLSGV
ncbi:thioredoxin family protein [Paenibacillus hunanensis]|uniref:thioredoxin family protein n=1 Tax=Paenibacillus hunanensis TaxID=539262 RepID=UPI00202609DC|nr:thioredoxin family protein [Paenibacillus hunanensis]MCL9662443.1 thioredoxin family protein [Paenibacillus hunanensis]